MLLQQDIPSCEIAMAHPLLLQKVHALDHLSGEEVRIAVLHPLVVCPPVLVFFPQESWCRRYHDNDHHVNAHYQRWQDTHPNTHTLLAQKMPHPVDSHRHHHHPHLGIHRSEAEVPLTDDSLSSAP